MSYKLAKIDRAAPISVTPDQWKLGGIANALPRLKALRMNAAARRLTEDGEGGCPGRKPAPAPTAKREPAEDRGLWGTRGV